MDSYNSSKNLSSDIIKIIQGKHQGKLWYLWHPDDIGTAKPMQQDKWFEVYQPLLLKIANSKEGREMFRLEQDLPPVVKMTKNSVHFKASNNRLTGRFYVGAKYANLIRYHWPLFKKIGKAFYERRLDGALYLEPVLWVKGHLVAAHATDTFYPDANPETTSVDGQIQGTYSTSVSPYNAGAGSWANLTSSNSSNYTWATTDTTSAASDYARKNYVSEGVNTSGVASCARNFASFDLGSASGGTGVSNLSYKRWISVTTTSTPTDQYAPGGNNQWFLGNVTPYFIRWSPYVGAAQPTSIDYRDWFVLSGRSAGGRWPTMTTSSSAPTYFFNEIDYLPYARSNYTSWGPQGYAYPSTRWEYSDTYNTYWSRTGTNDGISEVENILTQNGFSHYNFNMGSWPSWLWYETSTLFGTSSYLRESSYFVSWSHAESTGTANDQYMQFDYTPLPAQTGIIII